MSESEKSILNQSLVGVSSLPETLVYRNNTGQAWQGTRRYAIPGDTVRVTKGMVILEDARPVRFGLVGSGDFQGVHRSIAIAGETKDFRGAQREEQKRFQTAWEKAGGVYVMARSARDMVQGIRDKVSDRVREITGR